MKVDGTLYCTFVPRINYTTIYTTPAFFSLYLVQYVNSNLTSTDLRTINIDYSSAINRGNGTNLADYGFISPVEPHLGNSFSFTIRVPRIYGAYAIYSNINTDPFICMQFYGIFL